MFIVFKTLALAQQAFSEHPVIGDTIARIGPRKPNGTVFERTVGDFDMDPNVVSWNTGADGRVCVEHEFDVDALDAFLDHWASMVNSGDLVVSETMPLDWVSKPD